jgi:hypothetical protein
VLDLRNFTDSSVALTLLSLQGIVNREEPRIYLILDKYSDFWLQYALSKVSIQVTAIESPTDLIKKFSSSIKGLVVYDPSIPDTINVATTLAGLDDRLVVDPASLPSLQQTLGISDILDIRQMVHNLGWSNSPSGRLSIYRWVYDALWPRCDKRMIGVGNPGAPISSYPVMLGVRDYIVALRLVTLYLSPTNPDQEALYEKFLSTAPTPIPVFGWTENEEEETVSLASSHGDWVAVLSHIYQATYPSDLTVLSGIEVQPVRYEPKIDDNKLLQATEPGIYVTAYVTDGDNLGYDYSLGWDNWNVYQSSNASLGWTINPVLTDLAPLVWNYYMTTASADVTFVAGPSAAGYMRPEYMGSDQLAEYMEYARGYWKTTGLRTAQVLGWADQASPYFGNLESLGIFTGYLGGLHKGMTPFPLATPSELSFYFASRQTTPVAPNAYSVSGTPQDWTTDDIIRNLMSIVAGKQPGPITYTPTSLTGSGQTVYDPTSTAGTVRVGYGNQPYTEMHMVFGPYTTLPPGSYEVTYRLKTSNLKRTGTLATIDVATDLGEKILRQEQISTSEFTPDSWKEFKLNFEIQSVTNNVEFRIKFLPGFADLYADTITILKTDGWPLPDINHTPMFVAIGIIGGDPYKILGFLGELANIDPRIHLLNTDEFFAAINPTYLHSLTDKTLKKADPKLIPASTPTKVDQANVLFSNHRFGEYLTATRGIITDITAKLSLESNSVNGGILNPGQGRYVYAVGSTVTVSQNVSEGYRFLGWNLDGKQLGPNATTQIKMDSNHNLTAIYAVMPQLSTASTSFESLTKQTFTAACWSYLIPLFVAVVVAAAITILFAAIMIRRRGGRKLT